MCSRRRSVTMLLSDSERAVMTFNGPEPGSTDLDQRAVSAASWSAGRLDIFGVEANSGHLHHWWYENGWGNETLPGQKLDGGPVQLAGGPLSAVSWGPGRLDIFGVEADTGHLHHWWYDNGWGNETLPGFTREGNPVRLVGSALSAVSWSAGRLDIFGVEADTGHLHHWWYDNGWGNETLNSSGHSLVGSALSAVSWSAGRLDIFGVEADTSRLHHWWYDNGWGDETLPGPTLVAAPISAVSWQAGRLDIFSVKTDGDDLWHWWYDNGWGNEALGGTLFTGNTPGVSAVSWGPGRLDIFAAARVEVFAGTPTVQHWWYGDGAKEDCPEMLSEIAQLA
ncbi:hypothetical protein [Mycobacterium dioxanotrophicus]|nr:hypothetical protein [Mycobacterium dioxanotrophicus]